MPHVFHTDPYKRLLALLIEARRSAGLNQTELGKLMKRRQTFVSKVEQGERRLDLVEAIIWCRLVDADVHAIIDEVSAAIADTEI